MEVVCENWMRDSEAAPFSVNSVNLQTWILHLLQQYNYKWGSVALMWEERRCVLQNKA